MAGLTVTVCLPPEAADDIDEALTTALAPFDQDSDNPVDRGMWDSRRILGGSNGRGFAVVRGYEDDPRLIHDEPTYNGLPAPSAPGVCAGGPRALLDFSRPQAAPERVTAAGWDLWQQLSAVHLPALPLSFFEERWKKDQHAFPGGPWANGMLAAYRAQPLIKAYIHHSWSLWLGYPDSPISREHPIIGFRGSRADYIREYSWVPHNTDVLTVDGWWRESNGSALHAYCHPKSCPHQPPRPTVWPGSEAYLSQQPHDTILVRLHCHC
ncbi:hypothetical protein HEP85_40480 [Streptomyces sp. RPA4-2]|uniref:hypothetical protein n=1 Tax=Streptomyces sp. RPA4-2 TaxID=2721244 RepID=UPI00143E7370|nr:hypothetical protein [Streptomyces sp. RPA4-2]QIY66607.1 hypothetical protein HEP85_40480 [Streptomyces sp. RPA4-2]